MNPIGSEDDGVNGAAFVSMGSAGNGKWQCVDWPMNYRPFYIKSGTGFDE
jgi:hypothetical protein